MLALAFVRPAAAGDGASGIADRGGDFDAASAARRLTLPLAATGPQVASAVMPDATQDFGQDMIGEAVPAEELAAGLTVRVDHRRRKFRSDAVSWMTQHSATMGTMTDLLLGGSDSGWHVVVDPAGNQKYILEWKVRFR